MDGPSWYFGQRSLRAVGPTTSSLRGHLLAPPPLAAHRPPAGDQISLLVSSPRAAGTGALRGTVPARRGGYELARLLSHFFLLPARRFGGWPSHGHAARPCSPGSRLRRLGIASWLPVSRHPCCFASPSRCALIFRYCTVLPIQCWWGFGT